MASSKSFLLLFCALLALVLLVSAEVSTSLDDKVSEASGNDVEVDRYGHRHGRGHRHWCRYGCCRGYRHGRGCRRCCRNANEAPDAEFEDDIRN